jgi:O-acetyl-ADP-ribose deacetylase (regulator of RNase III)
MDTLDRMEVRQGDITTERVDAIVNAANESLLGGGGVDGAIHRAAGPEMLAECRTLGGCATGDAKVTRGYNLPAKWVIHTVGPVWRGGQQNEDAHGVSPTRTQGVSGGAAPRLKEDVLLASAYLRSLQEAARIGARSVAFPAISTGAYRCPPERAARIAVRTIRAFLDDHPELRVRLIAFSRDAAHVLEEALEQEA